MYSHFLITPALPFLLAQTLPSIFTQIPHSFTHISKFSEQKRTRHHPHPQIFDTRRANKAPAPLWGHLWGHLPRCVSGDPAPSRVHRCNGNATTKKALWSKNARGDWMTSQTSRRRARGFAVVILGTIGPAMSTFAMMCG